MHKTKDGQFVGIEYVREDGKKGGFLLQAKNDKYRGLLAALKGVTGKEVETEGSLRRVEEGQQAITSRTESQEQNKQSTRLPAEPQSLTSAPMLGADGYNQEGMKLYSLNKFAQAESAFREAVKLDALQRLVSSQFRDGNQRAAEIRRS